MIQIMSGTKKRFFSEKNLKICIHTVDARDVKKALRQKILSHRPLVWCEIMCFDFVLRATVYDNVSSC